MASFFPFTQPCRNTLSTKLAKMFDNNTANFKYKPEGELTSSPPALSRNWIASDTLFSSQVVRRDNPLGLRAR
jgi:hypothetical protein